MDEMTKHRKKRLRALINAAPYNGSQLEFARAVGLSEGRVSQLLDAKESFGERSARKIETELRLPERYFEQGFVEAANDEEFVLVRRVGVRFSNGAGQLVYYEDERPPLSFRADFLRKMGIPQGRALVAEAEGISNEPKIWDGSVVLINSADTSTLNNHFYAFRVDGELLIKRLSRLEGVGILATAENSNFSPKNVVYREPADFEIIGRVVWTGAML